MARKAKKSAKKKAGRRRYPGTRTSIAARLTAPVYQQVREAAEANGRSLSEEIERRLELSFSLGAPETHDIVVRMAQQFNEGWQFSAKVYDRMAMAGSKASPATRLSICYRDGVARVLNMLVAGHPNPNYDDMKLLIDSLRGDVDQMFETPTTLRPSRPEEK